MIRANHIQNDTITSMKKQQEAQLINNVAIITILIPVFENLLFFLVTVCGGFFVSHSCSVTLLTKWITAIVFGLLIWGNASRDNKLFVCSAAAMVSRLQGSGWKFTHCCVTATLEISNTSPGSAHWMSVWTLVCSRLSTCGPFACW